MSDNNPRPLGWLGPWCLLVGVVLLVTGLFFAIGGFKLVSLGGSWYFLIAGVFTLLSAIQFFRRKSSAVGLFALVFLGTLIWAFFDAGLDFWPLVSRLMVPAGLMVLANRRAGMFRREDISELALAYLREGLAVARAEGAKLDDAVAQEILANFQRAPEDLGTSILADRQAERPMEWDIRNGVIQRYGRKHGIAVPISDVVVPLLAAGSEGPG